MFKITPKTFVRSVIIIYLMFIGVLSSFAQKVIRGPYLQKQTSSSIVVMWRTDVETDSKITFGTALSNLTNTVTDQDLVTDHEVTISGLSDHEKYYYSVGSSAAVLSPASTNQFFYTAPMPGTVQPIRVWAIGDFGKGDARNVAVRDAYLDYTDNIKTDVWIWLGDNAYDDGTDAEYQKAVFDSATGYFPMIKTVPFWPCAGNHDYRSVTQILDPDQHTGAYYDIVCVPEQGEAGGIPSNNEVFYSFDYGNVHFISLNSEAIAWTGAGIGISHDPTPMTIWLEQDLMANDKDWVIVFWHQPPYSKGSHDSDDFWEFLMQAMRENFVPIMDKYGVDLVLNGHSHVYERSYLIKEHTGRSGTFEASKNLVDGSSGNPDMGESYIKQKGIVPNSGTVYAVCGNSGAKDGNPDLDHPAMQTGYGCDTCLGSLVLDIHGDTLLAKFLSSGGEIKDKFQILKQGNDTTLGFERQPPKNAIGPIRVFPSPIGDAFTLKFELQEAQNIDFRIYDVLGNLVYGRNLGRVEQGLNTRAVNISDAGLSEGTYILQLSSKSGQGKIQTIKLKQRR